MTRPRRSWGARIVSGLVVVGWEAAVVVAAIVLAVVSAAIALALV